MWYNKKSYNNTYPATKDSVTHVSESTGQPINSHIVDLTHISDNNYVTGNRSDFCGIENHKATGVSYNELNTLATELCRTVINDKSKATETYVKLKEWIDMLRGKKDFELKFINNVPNVAYNDAPILHAMI